MENENRDGETNEIISHSSNLCGTDTVRRVDKSYISEHEDDNVNHTLLFEVSPGMCPNGAVNISSKEISSDFLETDLNCTSKDLNEVLTQLKLGKFHVIMLLLTGGGYFAACSEILVFVFLSKPAKKEWNLHEYEYPWLPFFSGIAGIVGGYVFGTLSDRYGRQIPFIVSIGICCVCGLGSAFAPSFALLIAIRSMVSFGVGGLEAVDFVLLLEFLPPLHRGSMMVAVTFFGALGAILTGGLAWLIIPTWGWRWFVGASAIPSIIIFFLRLFIRYESPRYLFSSGKKQEGMKVLKIIAAKNKTNLTNVEIICETSQDKGHICDLMSTGLRGRTITMTLVWCLQSMGYWGTTIYLPEYLDSLGVDSYFNMFTILLGELPGLVLAMVLIEKHMLGRIKCLRFFSLGTSIALLLFAFLPLDFLKAVVVVVCYFFMVPIYSILNAFTPEIYPTRIRSTAMGWANIAIEIPGLITPFVGAVLLSSKIKWLYPVVWSVNFFLQFLCSFGFRVETAGKNLISQSDASQPENHSKKIQTNIGEELPANM
ncbi:uncharacterized protein LOC126824156 [Patella vulgata]|uniref:uncharacterized protein LOC126824156 n=1 Tax=Patella vulgata TaxID=6465 RepID=UPI0024A7CAD9|nr:uncharacterized protein LOC126824156 [Patella vulgata]XP_050409289.2 uncharacterized protein LOC126824156 [Patella vulgata]